VSTTNSKENEMTIISAAIGRARLGAFGLGPVQAGVLGAVGRLAQAHGATYGYEITVEIGVRQGAVASAIKTLRERGLVEEAPRESRLGASPFARLLRLTDEGREAVVRLRAPGHAGHAPGRKATTGGRRGER
jgi:DNA-binding MarR family transcriptional regulator